MGGGDKGDPLLGPTTDDGSGPTDTEEQDETRQLGVHEHPQEEESEEPEEPEEPDSPSSGAPVGGGGGPAAPGIPPGVPVAPPTGEDPVTEDPDDEEEPEPETSEPESETPEPENDNPEREREREEPDRKDDVDDDVEEDRDDEDRDDDEDDDDDDDEEEEQEAQVVIHSDSWDNLGWGLYPIRYQLQEEYGDQIQIDDRLVPVREFDSLIAMEEKWNKGSRRHQMPVESSVWESNPPESTGLSNRACAAAREQSVGLAKTYIRRLRMAAIVEGENIEDREALFELAENVGLDTDQLQEDWGDVHVRTSTRDVDTPKTTIHVDGKTVTQSGYLHVDDLKMIFEQVGLEEEGPQPLAGFVDEYGPVAIKEVQQVYDMDKDEALNELQGADGVDPVTYGDTKFWVSMG